MSADGPVTRAPLPSNPSAEISPPPRLRAVSLTGRWPASPKARTRSHHSAEKGQHGQHLRTKQLMHPTHARLAGSGQAVGGSLPITANRRLAQGRDDVAALPYAAVERSCNCPANAARDFDDLRSCYSRFRLAPAHQLLLGRGKSIAFLLGCAKSTVASNVLGAIGSEGESGGSPRSSLAVSSISERTSLCLLAAQA